MLSLPTANITHGFNLLFNPQLLIMPVLVIQALPLLAMDPQPLLTTLALVPLLTPKRILMLDLFNHLNISLLLSTIPLCTDQEIPLLPAAQFLLKNIKSPNMLKVPLMMPWLMLLVLEATGMLTLTITAIMLVPNGKLSQLRT
jgi:hypothetical protein